MSRKPREQSGFQLLSPLLAIRAPLDIKLYAVLNVVGAPLIGLIVVDSLTATVEPLVALFVLAVLAVVGVNFLFLYGLLTLQPWGWIGSLAVHSLGAVIALISANVQGTVIAGLVVFYLLVRGNLYLPESRLPWST